MFKGQMKGNGRRVTSVYFANLAFILQIDNGVALTTNTVKCGAEKYQELLVNGKYGGKPI